MGEASELPDAANAGLRLLLIRNWASQRCNDVAHVDVPPIGAHRQALYPLGTVHGSVGPFIGSFRLQEGISVNAFLDLGKSEVGKRIDDQREVLRARRIELEQCRRVKRFGVTATQGQRTDILGINRLPAN